jgi:hypothetical protein
MAVEAMVLRRDQRRSGGIGDLVERNPAEPAPGIIDPRRIDQHAVPVVEPRLGRLPAGADVAIGRDRRGQGQIVDHPAGNDEQAESGDDPMRAGARPVVDEPAAGGADAVVD